MAMPTQAEISEMLVKHKMNVFTWSKAHDYKCKTVYGAIRRWAGRDDCEPHGGLTRLIMRDLAADIEAAKVHNLEEQVVNLSCEPDTTVHNS